MGERGFTAKMLEMLRGMADDNPAHISGVSRHALARALERHGLIETWADRTGAWARITDSGLDALANTPSETGAG